MNNKKKIVLYILLFFCMVIILTLFINIHIINSTKDQIINLNDIKKEDHIDAILVLGCKVNGNSPSLMLAKRLEKGLDVYNKLHSKILLSGDHGSNDYDEVDVMSDYYLNTTVNSEDLFLDHAGFSTYDSIYRAKYIFKIKKMVIITQEYHMYRALYLANKLDIDAIGIVANDIPQKTVMLKNEIREILSRNKSFVYGIIKPSSKYLGDEIPITGKGNIKND